ncbi:NADH oxidoreductase hcr [Tritonibacter multivorans]|uniref:NADH oxidoreductase hcr n=1 Tax=Tritonibacter multivorans TaxID=928856 RepID=A0A0P1GFM5_9RHOB|nr:hybrid-cluster NAD(P)-dependent oxidoreductase [Tritonibacter multivorans]MDA7421099.1 hybrid-cluster NAD(P)-dependent oxidoreductase [Tritonibacter multivorans]CUH80175.1 NADH oxidoreductase hcr [Tritonibacter multivorans]SFC75286.1 Ferredoxin-NADP reductase [Tritonibacter multivorans]
MALDQSPALPLPKPGLPRFGAAPRQLTLVDRTQDTSDIVTFTFRNEGGALHYLPGQAIALDLPMPTGTATRTFTLSSAPLGTAELSVTVKAAPDANATRWMHDHLEVGQQITGRGPFGQFSLAHRFGRPLLLVGGGSGFTPMMSMLRWLFARGEAVDVTVVQVARRVEDLLYTQELAHIAANMPSLKLFEVVADPAPGESWHGYRGRPDRAMLRSMVPDASRREAYCCGPQGFMDQIRRCLVAEGLSPAHFHTESFGLTAPKAQPVGKAVEQGTGHKVTMRGRTFEVAADQPLSAALAGENIRVPTGCGAGQCGTCKLRLVDGAVDMRQDGGLSDHEVAQGLILACCSTAKGPITLEDAS